MATGRTKGYRRYSHAQVRTGQLIGLLRGAGLSLAEIGPVLDDTAAGTDAAIQRLDSLLADLDRRHADRRLLIRYVQATLREGTDAMFAIDTRRVLSSRVMSIQGRLHAAETDGFVREAKDAFRQHLDGAEPTGPFTLIFHGVVSDDSDGSLEAVLGCPDNIQPSEIVGIRTEPGHDEAYTTITKAQWVYPAILAAYDAVACSPPGKSATWEPPVMPRGLSRGARRQRRRRPRLRHRLPFRPRVATRNSTYGCSAPGSTTATPM